MYLSYDDTLGPDVQLYFKIANLPDCRSQNGQPVNITIPDYLPSKDRAVLRFEWYALHIYPGVEFYSQCVDVEVVGNPQGSLPDGGDLFTIPGHLPNNAMNNEYRNPFAPGSPQFITGPEVATRPGGVQTLAPMTVTTPTGEPAIMGGGGGMNTDAPSAEPTRTLTLLVEIEDWQDDMADPVALNQLRFVRNDDDELETFSLL